MKYIQYGFHIVLLFFVICPYYGVEINSKCLEYQKCSKFLTKSVFNNYLFDNSDSQLKDIRNNLNIFIIGIVVCGLLYPFLNFLINTLKIQNNYIIIILLDCLISILFLFYLHSYYTTIVLIFATINFLLFHGIQYFSNFKNNKNNNKIYYIISTIIWFYNIFILFLKESYLCYRYSYFQKNYIFQNYIIYFLNLIFNERKYGGNNIKLIYF